MENNPNPYSPPQSNPSTGAFRSADQADAARRRKLAVVICLFSILVSLIFTGLDDMLIQTRIGPWPVICMSGTLALLSSVLTKDTVLAPLSCYGAVMGSAVLVSLSHDLRYAQLHLAMPIALGFSAPSFFVASWLAK